MTLRQALGDDVTRLHELLEELLDREEAVVLLFDGDRAVNYISRFGVSPSSTNSWLLRSADGAVLRQSSIKEINHASHEFDSSGD